jgi:hypothetical protein
LAPVPVESALDGTIICNRGRTLARIDAIVEAAF